ncbi:uncharacterized protein MONOS_11078p1 [Monocercomonoides exilis]|uniref:uncharacterized protein n=1 Tax=Monocercomonoides exilis TaxID=2049356 RepID=UPI00355A6C64|nr:hypothetical protein MONOS_11078p1 [Monocercomonoides exilis]
MILIPFPLSILLFVCNFTKSSSEIQYEEANGIRQEKRQFEKITSEEAKKSFGREHAHFDLEKMQFGPDELLLKSEWHIKGSHQQVIEEEKKCRTVSTKKAQNLESETMNCIFEQRDKKINENKKFLENSHTKCKMSVANTSLNVHLLQMESVDRSCIIGLRELCCCVVSSCGLFCDRNSASLIHVDDGVVFLCKITLLFRDKCDTKIVQLVSSSTASATPSSSSSLSIDQSKFEAIETMTGPFEGGERIGCVSISRSHFINTTNHRSTTTENKLSCLCASSIVGCLFESVCDVYYGGIVQSINRCGTSLSVFNSTFFSSRRSKNAEYRGTEGSPLNPGRITLLYEGEFIFEWCEWNGSHTSSSSKAINVPDAQDTYWSGGAMCLIGWGECSLLINFCVFLGCYSDSDGGATRCYNTLLSASINTNYSQCYSGTGGAINIYQSSCLETANCWFTNCTSSGGGGGIFLKSIFNSKPNCLAEEKGNGESACIYDCFFVGCQANSSSGGGLRCDYMWDSFRMRNIFFGNCSAKSEGGGLFSEVNGTGLQIDSVLFYFIFFQKCSCSGDPPYGLDVCIYDTVCIDFTNPFANSFTSNTNEKRVCYKFKSSSLTYEQTERKDWLPLIQFYNVGTNGIDFELCGAMEVLACKTAGFAVQQSTGDTESRVIILEGRHMSERAAIEIGSKKIIIEGMGKEASLIETKALKAEAESLISVADGDMWLQSLSIDHTSKCVPSPSVVKQTSPNGNVCAKDVSIASSLSGAVEDRVMACAVFVVYLSQLHLEDVTIARMRLAGPVLLEAGAAQTLMSKVGNITVENVSRTEGEGIMLSKRIEADERLQVQNVSIVECTCMAGDGGGMWIEMTEISSCVEVGGMGIETKMEHCSCSGGGGGVCLDVCKGGRELALDNLKFVECNCGGAGGKNIYVKGSEISESMINRKSFAFEFDENFYEDLVGFDRDVDGGVSFPLNVFFVEFKGLAHVGGRRVAGSGYGGSDASFCGFESFPCRTILYAASVRFNAGKRMIAVDEGYELREGIEMKDWEWEIWGSGSDLQMNVTEPDNLHSSRIISVEERASINAICSSGDTVLADVNYFVVCIKGGILRLVEFESKGMMRFCEGGLVNGDNAMIVEMKQCMLSRIEKQQETVAA